MHAVSLTGPHEPLRASPVPRSRLRLQLVEIIKIVFMELAAQRDAATPRHALLLMHPSVENGLMASPKRCTECQL